MLYHITAYFILVLALVFIEIVLVFSLSHLKLLQAPLNLVGTP